MNQTGPDPRRELTERVLASALFEKSPRLRSFLRYICESELGGNREQINEHSIGVHVFSRQPNYNAGDDSIVRSQARLLRLRLEEYFRTDGRHETLRIVIPKGSYVPFFEAAEAASKQTAAQAETQTGELPVGVEAARFAPVRTPGAGRRWMAAACLLLAALASAGAWVWHRHATPDPGDRLWSTLFDSGRPVIIVPADSTLVLLEEMTGQPVHLSNYLSRQYLATMALLPGHGPLSPAGLSDSRYTSMADLNLVSKMMRNASYARDHAEIRYARDLSIRDAKENNLVLIGGARANPWVELFAGDMNLYVDYDWKTSRNLVINKTPQPGEAPLYAELPGDASHRVYGLVAFVPSLDRQGSTLMVAGTSGAGTEAAADFLLSGRNMESFFQGIQRAGRAIPHFELLLEAQNMGGEAPQSKVLAYRLLP